MTKNAAYTGVCIQCPGRAPQTLTEGVHNAEIYPPLEDLSARLRRISLWRVANEMVFDTTFRLFPIFLPRHLMIRL